MTESTDSLLEQAERDAARIRRQAERDAEDTRREAIAAVQRLLQRLEALEFPLGQLVANLREEVEQVSADLEQGTPTERAEPPAEATHEFRSGVEPPREQDSDAPPREVKRKSGGLLGRLKSWHAKGIFITAEGACAICQRSFRAGSKAALAQSGWKVSGDVGLCPNCQADRWQLPEGARLPFRRGG